eukprot:UN00604
MFISNHNKHIHFSYLLILSFFFLFIFSFLFSTQFLHTYQQTCAPPEGYKTIFLSLYDEYYI